MSSVRPPQVAMDLSVLRQFNTGTEEFIEGLVGGLDQLGVSVIPLDVEQPLQPQQAQLGQKTRSKRSPAAKWFWESWGLAAALRRTNADVVHIPYLAHPPRPLAVPAVVTVHDLIPYRFPHYQRRLRDRQYFRGLKAHLQYAARFVAISQATREDLAIVFPDLGARTVVIPNGVHEDFYRPVPPAPVDALIAHGVLVSRPRLLYVGGYAVHKNVGILLRAASRVLPSRDAELVLIGAAHNPAVARLVATEHLERHVHITDRVSRAELRAWYACSTAFCFPSRYEGFGLPPAQALAAGVPVVASRTAALEEVLGEAALFAPPDDLDAWVHNLERLLDDGVLRQRLAALGQTRAGSYHWAAVAAQYADVYREVARS